MIDCLGKPDIVSYGQGVDQSSKSMPVIGKSLHIMPLTSSSIDQKGLSSLQGLFEPRVHELCVELDCVCLVPALQSHEEESLRGVS